MVSVKGFKSLLDVQVELGQINVFIGANGSGKSNLLEAIGLLGAAASGRVNDEGLLHRGVRPGIPFLYKSSFKGSRVPAAIQLRAECQNALYSVGLHNPLKYPNPAWNYKNEIWEGKEGDRIVGRSPASTDRKDSTRGLAALEAVRKTPEDPAARLLRDLEAFRVYSPDTDTLRGLRQDSQPGEPVGLKGGRLAEAVRDMLRDPNMKLVAAQALELIDWAENFRTLAVGDNAPLSSSVATAQRVLLFKDRFMAEKRNDLTGYDASEGALYVLFAAVLASSAAAPPVLAIDNFDHGLNPRLARALMTRFSEWITNGFYSRQILLTTHNPLVLDGLPLDRDDVRLFAVGRSRKGRTTIRRVNIRAEDLNREGELWTVSRMWIMGHIGGVPDV
jgi:energy-coupling factor transporter ATP-binding protein EcfA2